MSKHKKLKKILEHTVREVLLEDNSGGFGGGGYQSYDGMSFYDDTPPGLGGGGHEGGQTVAGMFLNPLKDVVRTAMWGLQYLTTKLRNLIPSIIGGFFVSMLPSNTGGGVNAVFNRFRASEKEDLKILNGHYKEVLARNWKALESNDVIGIAFLLNPQAVIAAKLIQTTPAVALSLLDAMTGGLATAGVGKILNFKRNTPTSHSSEESFHSGQNTAEYDTQHTTHEPAVPEKQQPIDFSKVHPNELSKALVILIQNKDFAAKVQASPAVKQSEQVASEILVKRVRQVMAAKTFAELQTLTGKDMTAAANQMLAQAQIPPQDIERAKPALLKLVKDGFKTEYIKGLRQLAQQDPSAVSAINKVIEQIRALT